MKVRDLCFGVACACLLGTAAQATTYDPTTGYAAAWAAGNNPAGDWSYGWSVGVADPLNLFSSRVSGPDGANQEGWIDPAVNCCFASPAVSYNNGPAFDDGNVAQAANQIDMVSSVFQNLTTDVVFTAPTAGAYVLSGDFTGDQRGIGVNVFVLDDGATIFSSSVTSFGQITPFNGTLNLAAGDSIRFAVQQGGGNQNTGLDVTLTTAGVPEPTAWAMMILGFFGVGRLLRARRRTLAPA